VDINRLYCGKNLYQHCEGLKDIAEGEGDLTKTLTITSEMRWVNLQNGSTPYVKTKAIIAN
jgi:hypothetical protein